MMYQCPYCGNIQYEPWPSCCGEVHFEEITSEEWEIMEKHELDLEDARNYIADMEKSYQEYQEKNHARTK